MASDGAPKASGHHHHHGGSDSAGLWNKARHVIVISGSTGAGKATTPAQTELMYNGYMHGLSR